LTEQEQDAIQETHTCLQPPQKLRDFQTPICLGTSTWRQMADGRDRWQSRKRGAYPDTMLRVPRATPSITKTLFSLTLSNCDLARAHIFQG
jgi:hypothetical protein